MNGSLDNALARDKPVCGSLRRYSRVGGVMRIHRERQLNPVDDKVLALTAVVRPILTGVLYSTKQDVVAEAGGYEGAKLKMLNRLHRPGDGDCGICFEYAVHKAVTDGDPRVVERIHDAAQLCNVHGDAPTSILFGLEKTGALQLIATAAEILTEDSRLRYGTRGQPAKLLRHLKNMAGAFRNRRTRLALPFSIRGLWKADLFVGYTDSDRWLATSVKINSAHLEPAAGLRIGIVPVRQGQDDQVRLDEAKNLVICPLRHDQDFMQTFYEGWRIVQAFLAADARVPNEVALPDPAHREVARLLAERREYPVLEVIEAITPFGQPELLDTESADVGLQALKGNAATELVIAPLSRELD